MEMSEYENDVDTASQPNSSHSLNIVDQSNFQQEDTEPIFPGLFLNRAISSNNNNNNQQKVSTQPLSSYLLKQLPEGFSAQCLGEGSEGEVTEFWDLLTGKILAAKKHRSALSLQHEVQAYRTLEDEFGRDSLRRLAFTLADARPPDEDKLTVYYEAGSCSLQDYTTELENGQNELSANNLSYLFKRMLEISLQLFTKGYFHSDIKPPNVAFEEIPNTHAENYTVKFIDISGATNDHREIVYLSAYYFVNPILFPKARFLNASALQRYLMSVALMEDIETPFERYENEVYQIIRALHQIVSKRVIEEEEFDAELIYKANPSLEELEQIQHIFENCYKDEETEDLLLIFKFIREKCLTQNTYSLEEVEELVSQIKAEYFTDDQLLIKQIAKRKRQSTPSQLEELLGVGIYVPLRCHTVTSDTNHDTQTTTTTTIVFENLEKQILEYLSEENDQDYRVRIIVGEAGSGKSTFLQSRLIKLMKEHSQELKFERSLIMRLHLQQYASDLSKLLNETAAFYEARSQSIEYRDCEIILLLDGLDELSQTVPPRFAQTLLKTEANIKMVVTYRIASTVPSDLRPSFEFSFEEEEEEPVILRINELDDQQEKEFLFNFANIIGNTRDSLVTFKKFKSENEYLYHLENNAALLPLTKVPFTYKIVLITLPEIVRAQNQSTEFVFEEFVREWLKNRLLNSLDLLRTEIDFFYGMGSAEKLEQHFKNGCQDFEPQELVLERIMQDLVSFCSEVVWSITKSNYLHRSHFSYQSNCKSMFEVDEVRKWRFIATFPRKKSDGQRLYELLVQLTPVRGTRSLDEQEFIHELLCEHFFIVNSMNRTLTAESHDIVGAEEQNFFTLFDSVKNLTNLRILSLNFAEIDLGKNEEYVSHLSEGIKHLPPSLASLTLELQKNLLGSSQNALKTLFDGLANATHLQHLTLNLEENKFGQHHQNSECLIATLKSLRGLESIVLNLENNHLGDDERNMVSIAALFTLRVTSLNLNLSANALGMNEKNFEILVEKTRENGIESNTVSLKQLNLNLKFNLLTNVEGNMEHFAAFLVALPQSLEYLHLNLRENNLDKYTESNIKNLIAAIKSLRNLENISLNLTQNQCDRSLLSLIECCEHGPSELALNLSKNSLGNYYKNLQVFAEKCGSLATTLTSLTLVLDENNLELLGNNNMEPLALGLKRLINLEELSLSLSKKNLSASQHALPQTVGEAMASLADTLRHLTRLNSFSLALACNNISTLAGIGEAIAEAPVLTQLSLNLDHNALGSGSGALEELLIAFESCADRLTHLSLSLVQNGLGKQPLRHLANALVRLSNLTNLNLNLRNNDLGKGQLRPLSDALAQLTRLQNANINLQRNSLYKSMDAVLRLAQSLENVNELNLNLEHNGFEDSRLLGEALKNFNRLTKLTLSLEGNEIGVSNDLNTFSGGLQTLRTLQNLTLNLEKNRLAECEGGTTSVVRAISSLQQLHSLSLNVEENNLGQEEPNMVQLAQCFNNLPQSLNQLSINLVYNNMWLNRNNIENFARGLKHLEGLENLTLNIYRNNIGYNEKNMTNLITALRNFSKLQDLSLNLQRNNLGRNERNLQDLFAGLKEVHSLTHLTLNLQKNNLGRNENNLQHLSDSLEHFPPLEKLAIYLEGNFLGRNARNLLHLSEGLKGLPTLIALHLGLEDNSLGASLKYLQEPLKSLTSLQSLSLNLYKNNLGGEEANVKELGKALKLATTQHLQEIFVDLEFNDLGCNSNNLKHLIQFESENLQKFVLNLENNNLGFKNEENIAALLTIPQNLKHLSLNLWLNNLCHSEKNFSLLGRCLAGQQKLCELSLGLEHNGVGISDRNLEILTQNFTTLPQTLHTLALNLEENKLGESELNMKYLATLMLSGSKLEEFTLRLQVNQLGQDVKIMENLCSGFTNLENLKELNLNLYKNGLKEGIIFLANGISELKALEIISLDLEENLIGEGVYVPHLIEALSNLQDLQSVSLNLTRNRLAIINEKRDGSAIPTPLEMV